MKLRFLNAPSAGHEEDGEAEFEESSVQGMQVRGSSCKVARWLLGCRQEGRVFMLLLVPALCWCLHLRTALLVSTRLAAAGSSHPVQLNSPPPPMPRSCAVMLSCCAACSAGGAR